MAVTEEQKKQIIEQLSMSRSLPELKDKLPKATGVNYANAVSKLIDTWMAQLGAGQEPPTKEAVCKAVNVPEIGEIIYKLLVPRKGTLPEDGKTVGFNPAIHQAPDARPQQISGFDGERTMAFSAIPSDVRDAVAPKTPIATTPKEPSVLTQTVHSTLHSLALLVEVGNSHSTQSKQIAERIRKFADDLKNA